MGESLTISYWLPFATHDFFHSQLIMKNFGNKLSSVTPRLAEMTARDRSESLDSALEKYRIYLREIIHENSTEIQKELDQIVEAE